MRLYAHKQRQDQKESLDEKMLITNPIAKSPSMVNEYLHSHHL
jgi:hypothetical protein